MPAVTVDDVLTLPRVPDPDPMASRQRSVKSVTTAPSGLEGEGFPVRRAFAGVSTTELDPFVHMDQMGEVEYAPGEPKGTPWHPHRGFETVTYMIDGIFDHQDSNGGGGRITNGDTQWMTAGAGILHIEAPPEQLVVTGGLFHGSAVGKPSSANKWNPPRTRTYVATMPRSHHHGRRSAAPTDSRRDRRPLGARVDVHSHNPRACHAEPGSPRAVPVARGLQRTCVRVGGHRKCRGRASTDRIGQLAVFGAGNTVTFTAGTTRDTSPSFEVLLLGGRPIREPVVHYGPFVMNTKDEIVQALEDYQAGRLGTIPAQSVPHRHPGDVDPASPTDQVD